MDNLQSLNTKDIAASMKKQLMGVFSGLCEWPSTFCAVSAPLVLTRPQVLRGYIFDGGSKRKG